MCRSFICIVKDRHTNYFVDSYKFSDNETKASNITVTILPDDLPVNGTLDGVTQNVNEKLVIQERLNGYLIDRHHSQSAIGQIRKQEWPAKDYARGKVDFFCDNAG